MELASFSWWEGQLTQIRTNKRGHCFEKKEEFSPKRVRTPVVSCKTILFSLCDIDASNLSIHVNICVCSRLNTQQEMTHTNQLNLKMCCLKEKESIRRKMFVERVRCWTNIEYSPTVVMKISFFLLLIKGLLFISTTCRRLFSVTFFTRNVIMS